MAVLVDDDLGVLRVVDAALAERDRELARPFPVNELSSPNWLMRSSC